MNTSKTTISFNSLFYNTLEEFVQRIIVYLENTLFLNIDILVHNFNQDFHLSLANFKKISPNTTCLYSEDSTVPLNLLAESHKASSIDFSFLVVLDIVKIFRLEN